MRAIRAEALAGPLGQFFGIRNILGINWMVHYSLGRKQDVIKTWHHFGWLSDIRTSNHESKIATLRKTLAPIEKEMAVSNCLRIHRQERV